MKVLITAATSMELAHLQDHLVKDTKHSIHYLVTGVGAVSTTYQLMKLLPDNQFDLMIQMGIAGSFNHQLDVGTAVNVEIDSIAELGVEENNEYKDIFKMKLADENELPYSSGVLKNQHHHLLKATGLRNTVSVTNNNITTAENIIHRYKNIYKAELETMEGAAFHYVGIMHNLPFIQIRGISNYVGERNKNAWKIKEALDAATQGCLNLLDQL